MKYANGKWPGPNELIRSQAIAFSNSPLVPWEIQPKAAVGNLNSEDSAIWYDANRSRHYSVYYTFGYITMITAVYEINWENAKHYKLLDKALKKLMGIKY